MNLRQLQKHWNFFGKSDPLWAVLTHPEKRNAGWDAADVDHAAATVTFRRKGAPAASEPAARPPAVTDEPAILKRLELSPTWTMALAIYPVIDGFYIDEMKPVVREQLTKAGLRLAKLLNESM